MNKSKQLLNLIEEDPSYQKDKDADQKTRSSLDKFLEPSKTDSDQDDAIEKYRLKKQLRYMKKYSNNVSNDADGLGTDKNREYYWDANVTRVTGG